METPFLEAGEDAGRSEQLAALLDEFAAGLTGETATSPFASDVPAGEIAPAALRTEEATAGEERLQDQAGLVGGDEHFVAPGADVGEVSEAEGEGDIPGEADTEADAAETEESAQATTSYEELEDLMTAHDEPAALVDPSGEAQLVATLERPSDVFEVDEEAPPFERQVPPAAGGDRDGLDRARRHPRRDRQPGAGDVLARPSAHRLEARLDAVADEADRGDARRERHRHDRRASHRRPADRPRDQHVLDPC